MPGFTSFSNLLVRSLYDGRQLDKGLSKSQRNIQQFASAASIAGFRLDRTHLIIKPNHIFAFEFIAVTPIEKWGGKKIRFNIEDDAIVTENGVEWLYPPNERILLIY